MMKSRMKIGGILRLGLLLSGWATGCIGSPLEAPGADMERPAVDMMNDRQSSDLSTLIALPDLAVPVVVSLLAGATVSTLAGSGVAGAADGTGGLAQFDNPVGVALASDGTLYVTEYGGSRVRKVTAAGVVTSLTSQTGFVGPFAVLVDRAGLLVQTDYDDLENKDLSSGTIWRVSIVTGVATKLLDGLGRPRGLAKALRRHHRRRGHGARNTLDLESARPAHEHPGQHASRSSNRGGSHGGP